MKLFPENFLSLYMVRSKSLWRLLSLKGSKKYFECPFFLHISTVSMNLHQRYIKEKNTILIQKDVETQHTLPRWSFPVILLLTIEKIILNKNVFIRFPYMYLVLAISLRNALALCIISFSPKILLVHVISLPSRSSSKAG